jgi:hypothetical protein
MYARIVQPERARSSEADPAGDKQTAPVAPLPPSEAVTLVTWRGALTAPDQDVPAGGTTRGHCGRWIGRCWAAFAGRLREAATVERMVKVERDNVEGRSRNVFAEAGAGPV